MWLCVCMYVCRSLRLQKMRWWRRWTWTIWPWWWLLTVYVVRARIPASSLRTLAKKWASSALSSSLWTHPSWRALYESGRPWTGNILPEVWERLLGWWRQSKSASGVCARLLLLESLRDCVTRDHFTLTFDWNEFCVVTFFSGHLSFFLLLSVDFVSFQWRGWWW